MSFIFTIALTTNTETTEIKQVTPSKKRRFSRINLVSSCFQHLYVRPALHDFQKVCSCRQSSIAALFWKLEGPGKDFKPSHDYIFSISPHFAVEA